MIHCNLVELGVYLWLDTVDTLDTIDTVDTIDTIDASTQLKLRL